MTNLDTETYTTTATRQYSAKSIGLVVENQRLTPAQPLTQGVPLERGRFQSLEELILLDEDGNVLPSQLTELARWSDGSLRQVLVDWQAPQQCESLTKFKLDLASQETAPAVKNPVVVSQHQQELSVTVGKATWHFGPSHSLWGDCSQKTTQVDLSCLLSTGEQLQVGDVHTKLLLNGPIRTVVRTETDLLDAGKQTPLSVTAESHFFANSKLRKVTLTIRNKNRAQHPGGIWELGDVGSVLLSDVSWLLTPPSSITSYRCQLEASGEPLDCGSKLSLLQASSGGENWKSSNHQLADGSVPLAFQGYQLESDSDSYTGNRAEPLVVAQLHDERQALGICLEHFWQNFPKCLSADSKQVRIALFPSEVGYAHELQGGEQKTHVLWIQQGESPELHLLDAVRNKEPLRLDPEYVARTQAIRFLTPLSEEEDTDYCSLVQHGVEGDNSFFAKREQIDEYGWRHFGDAYGDHEAAFHNGSEPLVSHWNNQYDLIFGMGVRYLRGGDPRWFELMSDMVGHVIDIDLYHTDQDKAAYNHGLFWHTVHYLDAQKANHRSYPTGTVGGGPCAEHAYARGFQLYYYLTGDQAACDATVELADWVLAMEDGSLTPFRWLANCATGLSSASGNPDYHGPGRGPGNASETLLTAFDLTGDRKYLERVEELMYRVVHPDDDQDLLNLLDAETRWYYNLYLQALGRYLEIKAELGEFDAAFAYGQSTLVNYANWMAENEYPYLDKPEILEFPTETWAAQDMRKSEVFHFASLHAEGALRDRLRERAKFFYNYSVKKLRELPSRSYCRPIALLLGSGFSYDWFETNQQPAYSSSGMNRVTLSQQPFTPQKQLAVVRAKTLVKATILGFAAVLLTWVLRGS